MQMSVEKVIYRKATFDDVEGMHKIVNDYAQIGLMLPRSRNSIYENLRDYCIATHDGNIIGIGAIHFIWDRLAEVRSLAVIPDMKNMNIGRNIVERLEKNAIEFGVKTIFTLTYQPIFFEKCGYAETPKETLSQKVWKECVHCPKYPYCDEHALIKYVENRGTK